MPSYAVATVLLSQRATAVSTTQWYDASRNSRPAMGRSVSRYVPERDELEDVCRKVAHAAALCGLDLRRLFGTQADALCCTLPVGRGCE